MLYEFPSLNSQYCCYVLPRRTANGVGSADWFGPITSSCCQAKKLYFQCKFNIQGFSLQWKHACIELKIVDFSDWCRWLKVLKDRPVQPPSGFVVALRYQSLQIISNYFRDLPLNLLDIIKGFFQKRLIFYYTSVFHRVLLYCWIVCSNENQLCLNFSPLYFLRTGHTERLSWVKQKWPLTYKV